jgi:hypothetical protein
LKFDIHRADTVVDVQHLTPVLPAVFRLEHSAFRVALERITIGRNPRDVRICRMDSDRTNLTSVIEAGEVPVCTAIGGSIDAAAG